MPVFIGGGTPIFGVAQLHFDIGTGVGGIGQRRGRDRREEEIAFHPRRSVVDGKIGAHRSTGGGRSTRGVEHQGRMARGVRGFRKVTVVGGSERRHNNGQVIAVGTRSRLCQRRDVEGKRSVGSEFNRWLPRTSVSVAVCAQRGPWSVVGIGQPIGKGTVPHAVHFGNIRHHSGGTDIIGRTVEVDARLVDGVAGGVVHWKP